MSAVSRAQTAQVLRYKGAVIIIVDILLAAIVSVSVFALGNYIVSDWLDPLGEAAAQSQLNQAIESYERGLRARDPKEKFEAFREAVAQGNRIEEVHPRSQVAAKLRRDGRIGKFDIESLRNFVALEAPANVHVVIGRRTGYFGAFGDLAAGGAFLHWIEYGLSSWWPETSLQTVGGYVRGILMAVFIFAIYWARRLQPDASLIITNGILGLWGALAAVAALDDLFFRWAQTQGDLQNDLWVVFSRDTGSAMWFPTFLPFFQNAWLPYWIIGIVLTFECFALLLHREGFVFHFLRVHLGHRFDQLRRRLAKVSDATDDEDDDNDEDEDDRS